MIIAPTIAALRASDKEQQRLTAMALALERQWLDGAHGQALGTALVRAVEAHAAGQAVCRDDLAVLFGNWAQPLLQYWAGAWHAEPLLQLPLRHSANKAVFSLIAAQHHGAMLSLAMIDHRRWIEQRGAVQTDERISFHPGIVHLQVLRGEGLKGEIVTRRGDRLERGPVQALPPGSLLTMDGAHQALRLIDIPHSIVMQRLALPCLDPDAVAQDYRLADGALIHRSYANRQSSRTQMHMALLRAMGRADAAPIMAHLALNGSNAHDRWQAARECLATDTATGLALLAQLGSDSDPQLRDLVRRTREQLAVQLGEDALCHYA